MTDSRPADLPVGTDSLYREFFPSGGTHHVYRFANGYGASVSLKLDTRSPDPLDSRTYIVHRGTYGNDQGLYELAVIRFTGDRWEIATDTPIASDVMGWLDVADVAPVLAAIADLPAI